MRNKIISLITLLCIASTATFAAKNSSGAVTYPIPLNQLAEYSSLPTTTKSLFEKARDLSKLNLVYRYGSADPKNHGMDCSGTMYYLLHQTSLKHVPRQSDELFNWVEKEGKLHRVNHHDFDSTDFANLKPGDLLFWSGTYTPSKKHYSSITHVMLYLGKTKQGERVMFGASDGRRYRGTRINGVSVFDFVLPNGKGKQKFVGYGCIPHLTCT